MHFIGQTFSGVFEQFSLTSKFLGLKCKNRLFLRKMVLRVVFIKLMFRWLQTGLSDLKNTKQLNFAYGRFLHIFKNNAFSKCFEIFEIHQ